MKSCFLLIVTIVFGIIAQPSDSLVSVLFVDSTSHNDGFYTIRESHSFMKFSDSVEFFDSANYLFELIPYFQKEVVEVTINPQKYFSHKDRKWHATMKFDTTTIKVFREKRGGLQWVEYDTLGRKSHVSRYNKHGSFHQSIHYSYNEKGRVSKKKNPPIPWLKNYKFGIQPPTIFDVAHPTGFTLSGFNFHFQLPTPHIPKIWYRPTIALAAEAGTNGTALRIGLVFPELDGGYGVDWIHETPLTINASFTYIYREKEYKNLRGPSYKRWHVGVDVDYNLFFLGHLRFGMYRLIGPEADRPWNFMFSIGLSPAFFAIPFVAN